MDKPEMLKSLIPVRAPKSASSAGQRPSRSRATTYAEIRQRMQKKTAATSLYSLTADPEVKLLFDNRRKIFGDCGGDSGGFDVSMPIEEVSETENKEPFGGLDGDIVKIYLKDYFSRAKPIQFSELSIPGRLPKNKRTAFDGMIYDKSEPECTCNCKDDMTLGTGRSLPSSSNPVVSGPKIGSPANQREKIGHLLEDEEFVLFDAISMSDETRESLTKVFMKQTKVTWANKQWLKYLLDSFIIDMNLIEISMRDLHNSIKTIHRLLLFTTVFFVFPGITRTCFSLIQNQIEHSGPVDVEEPDHWFYRYAGKYIPSLCQYFYR